jgi:hypothetical protein
MRTLIATDIHGLTPALRRLFAPLGDDLVFLSPWDGEGCPHASEAEAAQAFHAQEGLRHYQEKIARAARGEAALLVGLSVGATSLWRYVASAACPASSRAVLYYGSRIREYRTLVPRCPTELVFAAHEVSFDPQVLAAELQGQVAACSVVAETTHGFLNPGSPHFRPELAAQAIEHLRRRLVARRAKE